MSPAQRRATCLLPLGPIVLAAVTSTGSQARALMGRISSPTPPVLSCVPIVSFLVSSLHASSPGFPSLFVAAVTVDPLYMQFHVPSLHMLHAQWLCHLNKGSGTKVSA